MVSINNSPVLELKRQLDIVNSKNLQLTKGTPVNMYWDSQTKRVKVLPILDGTANPIYRMKPDNLSLEAILSMSWSNITSFLI